MAALYGFLKMKKIVAAIVGCGVISPTHANALRGIDGVELRWACDLIRGKAENIASRFSIPRVSTDCADVFADPEVSLVCVCTDHASHADIVCAALDAGKNVLCEKALANNGANLDRMLAAAARHPELVASGVFQHRFDKVNRVLRGLLRDGSLGRLLTASAHLYCLRTDAYYQADAWRGTWALEGGSVLINQSIHFLDLLQWTMGGVAEISGYYDNFAHTASMECEDTAVASLRFRSGALGTIEATCASNLSWDPTIQFHGTKGTIVICNDKPVRVEMASPEEDARIRALLDDAASAPAPFSTAGKSYYGGGHNAQVADVVASIREGRAPEVPLASAAETVRMVFGLYESCRKSAPVKLA